LPGRRFDHLFFSAMALLMKFTVFVCFAHTYYLAGMFRVPLPSLIIHLHGAVRSDHWRALRPARFDENQKPFPEG